MSYSDGEPTAPIFYIGHHETKRGLDVSPELIQHAQDLGVSIRAALRERN
jgi:protein arginine N-methyltransferase 5